MSKISIILTFIVCFCLSACTVSREKLRNANFGSKVSSFEAKEKTKRYFEQVLVDPDSLMLSCSSDVRKGWARENRYDEPTYGYLVRCNVDFKNRYGKYTGNKEYAVVINDSDVFAVEVNKNASMKKSPERWMGYAEKK